MKIEYWIMNTDHNLWKVIQNENIKKSLGRDSKGGIIILPPVSFEEHVVVQRGTKARTLLLQSLPEDHMADFHHLDDAREIWLAEFSEFRVSEEEGLHKGYDRFQKILSQLNQMQPKLDNDDVNLKFLRALPPSWSQVALTLKTRGGLEYLCFDDLYNKLRSLEIDVKVGSSYGSRSTDVALTHSAFVGAASTNTKMVYSDQPSYSSSISYTHVPAGSIMKDVLHSFVAENEPTQQLAYEDFEQAGKKINFNNKDSARFNRRKARCYNCLQLVYFARECNVNKNEHDADNKTEEAEQVYGLMVGFESDFVVPAGNAVGGVNPAVAEFSMMGISPKDKIEKREWEVKLVESLARFDKWKKSSKNLAKLINSSMTTRTKLGLGFKEYFGTDEIFDLSTPNIFDPEPVTREVTFGSKSPTSITTSEANDLVSCDNSDKSSESETHNFASCVSSPLPADSFSLVDVKILPKSDVQAPSPTNSLKNEIKWNLGHQIHSESITEHKQGLIEHNYTPECIN
nr:ribonuclease H-like domain-containing protein [Tanacetum cinerariifolium]